MLELLISSSLRSGSLSSGLSLLSDASWGSAWTAPLPLMLFLIILLAMGPLVGVGALFKRDAFLISYFLSSCFVRNSVLFDTWVDVSALATLTALWTSGFPLATIDSLLAGAAVLSAISLNFISFISSAVGGLLNFFFGVIYLAVWGRAYRFYKAALAIFCTPIEVFKIVLFLLISSIFWAVLSTAVVGFPWLNNSYWDIETIAELRRAGTPVAFFPAFARFKNCLAYSLCT